MPVSPTVVLSSSVCCLRCLECVIGEQLRKVETTLKDINSLETATASANDRLSQVRASIRANEQQVGGIWKLKMIDLKKAIERWKWKKQQEKQERCLKHRNTLGGLEISIRRK